MRQGFGDNFEDKVTNGGYGSLAAGEDFGPSYDPVAVLGRLKDLYRGKIELELVRADPEAMEALAFVEFHPATETKLRRTVLHVSSNVWELAEAGDDAARALFAHEVGRIVLRNHGAMAG